MPYSNKSLTIIIIFVLAIMIFLIVYFSKKSSNKTEKFAPYNNPNVFKSSLKHSDIACNLQQPQRRYMYQAVPPAKNSSYDVRNPPSFTPAADKSQIGIFNHTGIFGNYTNERICPNYQQMENKILM